MSQTNVILFGHPLSPFAQRCQIALIEKNVKFTYKLTPLPFDIE